MKKKHKLLHQVCEIYGACDPGLEALKGAKSLKTWWQGSVRSDRVWLMSFVTDNQYSQQADDPWHEVKPSVFKWLRKQKKKLGL